MSKIIVLNNPTGDKMTLLRRTERLLTLHAGRVRPETNALKPKPKKVSLGSNAILLAIFSWLLASSTLLATAPGTAYLYDDAGRLIQATISDGTSTIQITYVYDQAGNLTGVSEQHLN
jgi:YD repeat-containing protein